MNRLWVLLLFAQLILGQTYPGPILLEDYSSLRQNGQSDSVTKYLWHGMSNQNTTCSIVAGEFVCTTNATAQDGLGLWLATLNCDVPSCYSNVGSYMKSYIRSGTWNVNANRLRFRYQCNVDIAANGTDNHWLEFGTYVRRPDETGTISNTDQGQHFYHYVNTPSKANEWVYVEFNRFYQHHLEAGNVMFKTEDPQWYEPANPSYPVHYYDGMTHFYFGPTYAAELRPMGVSCKFDDFRLDTVPGGADVYVSSISGAYNATTSKYYLSWFQPKHVPGGITYDVRYSTSSMRANGWSSGTSGGTALGPDDSDYAGVPYSTPGTMSRQTSFFVAIRPRIKVASTSVSGTVRLTSHADHHLATGDQVSVANVCTAANGTRTVTVISRDTISLDGTSGTCSYTGSAGTFTATSETTNFAELLIGDPPPPTPKKPGSIVVEDYSTNRLNSFNSNYPLTHLYSGEDPTQTGGVNTTTGYLTTVGATTSTLGSCSSFQNTGCGHYWYFVEYPRDWPNGYLQSWVKSGTWNTNVNRLYLKFKCDTRIPRSATGAETIQMGTYIRRHDEPNSAEQGPHYYHEVNADVYPNRWVYIQLNKTPTHQRSYNPTAYPRGWVDPEWQPGYYNSTVQGVHYFDGLGTIYFDTSGNAWSGSTCDVDYITAGYDTTPSPDAFVSSLVGTYSGTNYTASWDAFKDNTWSHAYETRYSTSSMRVNGWSSGTDGGVVSHPGDYYPSVNWSSPAMAEQQVLYLAVRPRMRVVGASVSGTVRLDTHSHHYLTTGDSVTVTGVCAAANGSRTITVIDADTISLDGTSGSCTNSGTGYVTSAENLRNFSELLIGEELTSSATPAPNITTTSLPGGTVSVAYSQTLAASDGTAPYSWAVSSGTICAGLSLSTAGAITGTPTTAQTCSFTVQVTDAASQTDTQALSITIGAAPAGQPAKYSGNGTISGRMQIP